MTGPKPPGPPLIPWTEAEIAARADVTPERIARARATWKRDASAPMKPLLDATLEEPRE